MASTFTIVGLLDDAQVSAGFDKMAAKSQTTADIISKNGSKAGLGFATGIDTGAKRAGQALEGVSAKASEMGIVGASSVGRFGSALQTIEAKGKSAAGVLSEIGKVSLVGGLVAFSAAAYEGVKGAADLQKQMEQIHTQAGATQGEVNNMTKAILNMAPSVATGPQALAEALYHIESVGMRGATALNVLKMAAEGAKVGNSNLTDTTNALDATVISGMKGVNNYNDAMGALNSTVGAGDMTMQDLSEAMSTGIDAVAGKAGVSITALGGALATFGDNNIRGTKAAIYLRQTIMGIESPSAAAIRALKSIGLTSTQLGEDLRKPNGIVDAIGQIKGALDKSGMDATEQASIIDKAFGGVKSGTGITVLLGEYDRLKNKTAEVEGGTKKFGSDWAATTHTMRYDIDAIGAGVQAFADRIGFVLIPKIEELGSWISKNKGLVEGLAEAIGGVLGVAIAFFVGQKIAAFVRGIGEMVTGIGKFVLSITGAAVDTTTQAAVIDKSITGIGTTSVASSEVFATGVKSVQASMDAIQASEASLIAATREMELNWAAATTSMSESTELLAAMSKGTIAQMDANLASIGITMTEVEGTYVAAVDGMTATTVEDSNAIKLAIGSTGVGLIIIALGTAITELMMHWNTVWPAMLKTAQNFAQGVIQALNGIVSTAEHIVNALIDVVNAFGAGIQKINVGNNTFNTQSQSAKTLGGATTKAAADAYAVKNLGVAPGNGAFAVNSPQIQSYIAKVVAQNLATGGNLGGRGSGNNAYVGVTPKTPLNAQTLYDIGLEKGLKGLALSAQQAQVRLDEVQANPKSTQAQLAAAELASNSAYNKANPSTPLSSLTPAQQAVLNGNATPSASTPLSAAQTAFLVSAEQFVNGINAANKGGTSLSQQAGTVAGLRRVTSATNRSRATSEEATLNSYGNTQATSQAGKMQADMATAMAKLTTIADTDFKTGQSKIATLQSAIASATMKTLRVDVTGVHKTQMEELVKELRDVHMAAETKMANQVVAAFTQAQSALAEQEATRQTQANADTNNVQAAENAKATNLAVATAKITTQAALDATTQASDQSKAQTQAVTDATTIQTDNATAAYTQFEDAATALHNAATALTQQTQDITQGSTDTSAAIVQAITDSSQTQVDTINERGKWGLALVAQQQQVVLDQVTAANNAKINAQVAHNDALKLAEDQAIAAQQANVDAVAQQTAASVAAAQQALDLSAQTDDAAVAVAQARADSVSIADNIKQAAAQATEDADNMVDAVKVASAQAHVDAVAQGTQLQINQANAALALAQSTQTLNQSSDNNALTIATSNTAADAASTASLLSAAQTAQALDAANHTATLAAETSAAQQMNANAQAALVALQDQAALAEAEGSQTLSALQGQALIQEEQLKSQIALTQAMEATQFAGSGIVVNINGINPTDSAAVSDALGWVLRTQVA